MKKENIIKRTTNYVLFDVDGSASAIINAKFLRKKESEDAIFFSVPADYKVTCRVKEYKEGKGWQVVKEFIVTAEKLRPVILMYNKANGYKAKNPNELPKDELPF